MPAGHISNFERMLRLADESFMMKNDPSQIAVDELTAERLRLLHPATLNEKTDKDGPVAWVLVIPTTGTVMSEFLSGKINERELLQNTPLGIKYSVVYLCSALVLPEYRRKKVATDLTISAVRSIRKDHPITDLLCWPFSAEGRLVAEIVAEKLDLPVHFK